jgi:hypothetical protein
MTVDREIGHCSGIGVRAEELCKYLFLNNFMRFSSAADAREFAAVI